METNIPFLPPRGIHSLQKYHELAFDCEGFLAPGVGFEPTRA